MDTGNLTWRDKVQIADVTARIAVSMFLGFTAVAEIIVVVVR